MSNIAHSPLCLLMSVVTKLRLNAILCKCFHFMIASQIFVCAINLLLIFSVCIHIFWTMNFIYLLTQAFPRCMIFIAISYKIKWCPSFISLSVFEQKIIGCYQNHFHHEGNIKWTIYQYLMVNVLNNSWKKDLVWT